jgi:hypothetical protein
MTTEQEPKAPPEVPTAVIVGVFVSALGFHAAGFFVWRAAEVMDLHWKLRDPNTYAHTAVWLAALGIGLLSIRAAQADERGRPPRRVRHPLCCGCLVPYIEGAHFCPTCACPLTWFSGTGGYEQIYARAWIVGKAANHPTRLMHVWLLTIAAIGSVAGFSGVLWSLAIDPQEGSGIGLMAFPLSALSLVSVWIWVSLALRSWSRWGLASTDADDGTAPVRYGSPPWWTRDEHWRVPLAIGDEDEFLPEPASDPSNPSA